jgi:hypothetical protein
MQVPGPGKYSPDTLKKQDLKYTFGLRTEIAQKKL